MSKILRMSTTKLQLRTIVYSVCLPNPRPGFDMLVTMNFSLASVPGLSPLTALVSPPLVTSGEAKPCLLPAQCFL